MYWQEDDEKKAGYQVPDDVQDLVFEMKCKSLPVDHAHSLSTAIVDALPWLEDEENAGIHLIHVAESGNGWLRPEDTENEVLYVSRRTKFTMRLPKHRIGDAETLLGQQLDIDGHQLELTKCTTRLLQPLPTLFARYIISTEDESEVEFMQRMAKDIQEMGIQVKKMMPGRSHKLRTPEGGVHTRSLMLADLTKDDAITLQQLGVGEGRKIGCGLFVPHKGIKAVNSDDNKTQSKP
jgi:CRISPR-associated protein Cas6